MKPKNFNSMIALGTGTSTGVPMIGCSCQVCRSIDHRDQRLRTSIFIETRKGKKILVDTTPDLRTQLLANKISDINFVIMTHDHADHLHGIDDLRPLTFGPPKKIIPLYCNKETLQGIQQKFQYIFKERDLVKDPILGGGIPRLSLHEVELLKKWTIEGEEFTFFNYPHGKGTTMGLIHEGLAYIVDCNEINDQLLALLKKQKLKWLVLDCLQRGSHATHLTTERAFHYIEQINPERAGLIHISHDLSHRELSRLTHQRFGTKVIPLYDQLKLFY